MFFPMTLGADLELQDFVIGQQQHTAACRALPIGPWLLLPLLLAQPVLLAECALQDSVVADKRTGGNAKVAVMGSLPELL